MHSYMNVAVYATDNGFNILPVVAIIRVNRKGFANFGPFNKEWQFYHSIMYEFVKILLQMRDTIDLLLYADGINQPWYPGKEAHRNLVKNHWFRYDSLGLTLPGTRPVCMYLWMDAYASDHYFLYLNFQVGIMLIVSSSYSLIKLFQDNFHGGFEII